MDAPKPVTLIFLLIITLLRQHLGAENGDILKAPCVNIDKVDFKNAAIEVKRRGVLKFDSGASCSYDSPDHAEAGHPDWQNKIILDHLVNPEAGLSLRMIVISSKHLTGTGSWETVLIFTCMDGHLLKIFDRQYLYGAKVTFLEPQVMSIASPDWDKDDSMCCPSHEKRESFKWNSVRKTFYLFKTIRKKVN